MVMPSTSTSFDCSSNRMACIFEPAGPKASWSMTTLRRGVASAARQSTVAPSVTSAVMTSSVQTAAAPNQVFGMRGGDRSTTVSLRRCPGRVDYHSHEESPAQAATFVDYVHEGGHNVAGSIAWG